jgi:hypothetical protein
MPSRLPPQLQATWERARRPADQDHHGPGRGHCRRVAVAISYGHAYELISAHDATGRLVSFTVGGAHPGLEPDLTQVTSPRAECFQVHRAVGELAG